MKADYYSFLIIMDKAGLTEAFVLFGGSNPKQILLKRFVFNGQI